MAAYALQTKGTTQSVPQYPTQILGLAPEHELRRAKLPTKRKRETICQLGSFKEIFCIKPFPESPFDEPEPFKPIRVIGRSQLPFSFLESAQDEAHPSSRLFHASIEVLEDQDSTSKVLIARHEAYKSLYAIERVRPQVFSVSKLAWWLKEKDVEELWDPLRLALYPAFFTSKNTWTNDVGWWQQAAVSIQPEERQNSSVRISMLRPDSQSADLVSRSETADSIMPGEIEQPTGEAPVIPEIPKEAPSAAQLLETFVEQYLEAVYLSKMSLAYFAKGPIARVRSAFTSSEDGAPPTHELIVFLKSMLLTHKASDKKYQEKLPEVVRGILPGSLSDDEGGARATKPKKSKRKVKLNRVGMYPQEEDVVKKWWLSGMSSQELHSEETLDQRIKRRVGDLRVREALAQMILMLEIIALEALSPSKGIVGANAPDGETQEESQLAASKKRKKKTEDIRLLMDLLLDKLCIWQSVDQVGILDFDAKAADNGGAADETGKPAGNDKLQGFCVEVIIPFYMSRVPEQARLINKKLGGPIHASPPKRKALKAPTTSRQDEEAKQPDLKKSRRSLARVATDTVTQSLRRSITPSLNRSTTEPNLIKGIKREPSEIPMAAIPFQRSPSNASRQSMSRFDHLKGRQINLSAPSAAAEAKLKQKQRVEEDLKEAIATLKKPNRGLAAGSYVDEIERRGLGSATKSRKPATTVRKVCKDVQVSATPRMAKRTKDIVQNTPKHNDNPFVRENAPPSSFCIPSSAVRSVVPGTVQRDIAERNARAPAIAETPSKPSTRRIVGSPDECRRAIFATPAKRRDASPRGEWEMSASPMAVYDTPAKADSNVRLNLPHEVAAPLTPTKSSPPLSKISTSLSNVALATPVKAAAEGSENPSVTFPTVIKPDTEPSIYDALGWNDDDDDLL